MNLGRIKVGSARQQDALIFLEERWNIPGFLMFQHFILFMSRNLYLNHQRGIQYTIHIVVILICFYKVKVNFDFLITSYYID